MTINPIDVQSVMSYEHFVNATDFPSTLYNNIFVSSAQSLETFLVSINNSLTTYASLMSIAKQYLFTTPAIFFANEPTTSQPNMSSVYWMFGSNLMNTEVYITSSFCEYVRSQFSDVPNPITTLDSNGQNPYSIRMQAVFSNVFINLYGQLRTSSTLSNTAANGLVCASCISGTSLSASLNIVLNDIIAHNMTFVLNSTTVDMNSYLENVYAYINSAYISKIGTNTSLPFSSACIYNLMAICLKPFFCFLYLNSYLPSASIVSSNPAPRDGISRGQSVLSMYKFVIYTLYAVYNLSAKYDPSSGSTLILRQAIDYTVISQFNLEFDQFAAAIKSNNTNMDSTIAKIDTTTSINQDIVMARANAINISNNETTINASQKKATTKKIVWFVFLILYNVFFGVVFFFFKDPKKTMSVIVMQTFFVTSCIIFLVLLIFAFISV